jgi:hypothetical protein
MSEQALAAAVLHLAVVDACAPWQAPANNHYSRTINRQIEDACAFWAATDGEWAEARAAWCDTAGVDPAGARRHALALIAKERGACILTTHPSGSGTGRIETAPPPKLPLSERQARADRAHRMRLEGKSYADIRAELRMTDREVKSAIEMGRQRAARIKALSA